MFYDKNSDIYDKSTEPFFVTYSNLRHVEYKKRLLVYCDLMADLTVFSQIKKNINFPFFHFSCPHQFSIKRDTKSR